MSAGAVILALVPTWLIVMMPICTRHGAQRNIYGPAEPSDLPGALTGLRPGTGPEVND